MQYRREIDGLRALAVVPVILFHAGFAPFSGGFIGVDVFFVISGYLITTILIGELKQDRFSLLSFYERRARRILPALFCVLGASLIAAWALLLPREMKDFAWGLLAVAAFSSNILFWRRSGYFDTAAELNPLLHTWSLAVEEQYYILFPLLLMALWRFGRGMIPGCLLLAFCISLGLAEWGAYNKPTAAFFLLPTRGWEILLGAFCAFRLDRSAISYSLPANLLSLAGLVLIAAAVVLFDEGTPMPGLFALVPTFGVVLLITFAVPGTLAHAVLGWRYLVGIGLISYSAYLWHQPILVFARIRNGELSAPMILILLMLTFVLAVLTWKYVELPFRDRVRIGRRPVLAFSAGGLASLVAVAALVIGMNGNLFRYTKAQMRTWGNLDVNNDFVWAAKRQLRNRAFDDPARQNVLVIGDSLSGDFLNVLMSLEDADRFEFSTMLVWVGCGNLALPRARFETFVDPAVRQRCERNDGYAAPVSKTLLQEADLVVIASSWRDWELELLPASLAVLEDTYGRKFLVVGRKSLLLDRQEIVALPEEGLEAYRTRPRPEIYDSRPRFRELLGNRFVDLYPYLCEAGSCRLFDQQGEILVHDGEHLSLAGVAFMADRFGSVQDLLDQAD